MRYRPSLSWPQAWPAMVECGILAVACLLTYSLITALVSHVYSLRCIKDLGQ
jgi:hypothetical protein